MRRCPALFWVLSATAIVSTAGAGEPALVLVDGGIQFPDGTIQETSGALATGPPTLTVAVDCGAGESINRALQTPAVELTVDVSGVCNEDVVIRRPFVTLRGGDPLVDGVGPAGVAPTDRPVNVFDTFDVRIEKLGISGGNVGVGVNSSFSVEVVDCRLSGHTVGLIVGTGGAVRVEDTVVSGNLAFGLGAFDAAHLTCIRCIVEGNGSGGLGDGFRLTEGSELELEDSAVEGRRAIDVQGGGRVYASGATTVVEGLSASGSQAAAIRAIGNVSIEVHDASLVGPLDLQQKSVAKLVDATQTMTGFTASNRLSGDSALQLTGTSSLAGDVALADFSTAVFAATSTVSGNVTCSSGADASCGDPAVVGGSADCEHCTVVP